MLNYQRVSQSQKDQWRGASGSPAAVDLRFGAGRRRRRLGPIFVHQRLATRGCHVRLHLPGADPGLGRALLLIGIRFFSENQGRCERKCEIFIRFFFNDVLRIMRDLSSEMEVFYQQESVIVKQQK